MGKKIVSILLIFSMCIALCVSLVACGESSDKTSDVETTETTEETEVSYDIDVDTSVEDLVDATMGIPADTVLFTVDGQDVTAELFFYWLTYDIYYYSYYASYYGESIDLNEDKENLLNDAKLLSAQTVLIPVKTVEMGYEMSDEMQQQMNDDIEAVKEGDGGEEAFIDELRKMGIDEKTYNLLAESSYCAELLNEDAFEGQPTQEQLEEYVENNDLLYMKHILLLTVDDDYEPLSDDEKAEKFALAQDIVNQLKDADDIEAEFDELMNEYSEDTGLESYPDGYLFSSGEMVDAVEDAVRELEIGEVSDIVEYDGTDDGYYSGYHIILRLDPTESEDAAEYWREDEIDSLISGWSDNADYEYTDAYETIENMDLEEFYAIYSAYQQAFSEEEETESESEDVTEETEITEYNSSEETTEDANIIKEEN